MSDVTVAPDASPAPSSAPPQAGPVDIPVTPAQPGLPTPIGSQAPTNSAPGPDFKGSEHRPQSRREAINAAFERAEKAKNAKPADAKPGHNQPPEPTPRERPKADPEKSTFDLRKRPSDQPKQEEPEEKKQDDRPRAEHGHFAPRQQQQAPPQQQPQAAAPSPIAHQNPLPRMSDRAKADWSRVPESVQQDVHRLNNDFTRAYQTYRADHETMNTLRPYAEMARASNTTLARAFENYVSMEEKLRSNLVAGLDQIINNLNLVTNDGSNRRLTLADVAWHIVNQTPEQHALIASQNAAQAQANQLAAANQRIAALEQNQRQVQYQQDWALQRGVVEQYSQTHARVDELADLIVNEINLGYDLDTAYQRAALLRPAKTAPQTRNGTTAAQTRAPTSAQTRTPDRSISGAPGGTSNGTGSRPREQVSRREAIANAMKRANGSL